MKSTTTAHLACGVTLALASIALAQPTTGSLYASSAEILAPAAAFVRAPISDAILDAAGPDFSDMRLIGLVSSIDYVIESAPIDLANDVTTPSITPIEATQETLDTTPPSYLERFDLELPTEAPAGLPWELVVDSANERFTATITFLSLAPGAHPLAERTMFRLPRGIERKRFALPAGLPPRFRVEIRGQDGFVSPTFSFVSTVAPSTIPQERIVSLRVAATHDIATGVVIEVELPARLHPSILRFESTTPAFTHDVSIVGVADGKEVVLGEGPIERGATGDFRDVPIGRTASNRLRIVVTARPGATRPSALRVVGVLRNPTIVFSGNDVFYGSGRATLLFGGRRVRQPAWAETTPMFEEVTDQTVASTIESITANPNRIAPPALRFAMRAGAAIDERVHASVARLAVPASPEGLVRVSVPVRVLVASNDDASDLRVVDGSGRQWPYVVDYRDESPLPMLVRATRTRTEQGRSSYRIALPARGVPIVGVRLETNASLVDRPVSIESESEEGTTTIRASSQLVRSPGVTAPVDVRYPRTRERALRVIVEDRNEAPLDLRISLLFARRELLLAAPAGTYRLFVGALPETPESNPAHYDLERAGELVFEVPTTAATVGALADNPAYEPPSALSRDRWRDIVLWIVLGLATALLFAFTYRLVRAEGPAPS